MEHIVDSSHYKFIATDFLRAAKAAIFHEKSLIHFYMFFFREIVAHVKMCVGG